MFIIKYSTQDHLLDHLIKLHYLEIQEISVAPNDEEVFLVLGNTDMPHDEYAYDERNRSIWKCDIQSGEVTQLTLPKEDAFAPSWSKDSNTVAYFSNASGKKQLWLMNPDGTNKRKLTALKFSGRDPFCEAQIKWSPNGSMIAYTAQPNGSFYGLWQSLVKQHHLSSSIQVDNGENKLQDFFEQARETFKSALYLVNIETGENKPLIPTSKAALAIISWCTDGQSLLVKDGRNLFKINTHTLQQEHIYHGHLDLVHVKGTTIQSACIKDKQIEISRIENNELAENQMIKLNGNEPITLHNWSQDGKKLYYTSQSGISNILYAVNVENGETKTLTEKGKTVEDHSVCLATAQNFHQKDSIIFPYSSPHEPMELWEANATGDIRKVSKLSDKYKPNNLPKVEVLTYESKGWEIESLLVYPKDYKKEESYPTLIYLHGGPEDYVRANFSEVISGRAQSVAHYLAEQGYAVLLPNFRGSSGYDEAFMYELSHYNMMRAPYEDVIAGVDHLIQVGVAHPEKLGIYGTSFGAWLTAWTISQTSRFKSAVGMVGIYDLLQRDRYANGAFHSISDNRGRGTKPNDLWFNPEVYKKFSPMEHFEQIQTPMLFIETGAERENIGSEAKPLFHALLAQNVKTKLIYYPEAYHNGGWNDEYKRDYMKRLVAWFDHCIKGRELPDWFE